MFLYKAREEGGDNGHTPLVDNRNCRLIVQTFTGDVIGEAGILFLRRRVAGVQQDAEALRTKAGRVWTTEAAAIHTHNASPIPWPHKEKGQCTDDRGSGCLRYPKAPLGPHE